MPQFPDLPDIDAVTQLQTVTFDFGPLIAANCPPGTTIVLASTPTITCASRVTGADPSASTRAIGAPQIGTASQPGGSGLVNCAVLQQFGTMIGGVSYLLTCLVQLTSGDVEPLWGYVTCVTPS